MRLEPIKALSIRQPWAWAIFHAGKDVENRPERIARMAGSLVGQRIYIHAGLTPAWDDAIDTYPEVQWPEDVWGGCLLGTVEIAEIVTKSKSKWFQGPYGIVFVKPKTLGQTIDCKGQLGFFRPKI